MNPYIRTSQLLSTKKPAAAPPTYVSGGSNTSSLLDPSRKPGLYTDYGFDPRGDNENVAMLKRLSMGMYPGLAQGVGFYNELAPYRQGAIKSAMRVLDPRADTQAKIDAERARNDEYARAEMARTAQMLAQNGYGSGAVAGAQREIANQAGQRTLDYSDNLNDPEYQSRQYEALLSLVDAGMNIPGLDQLLGMTSATSDWTKFRKASQQSGGGILGGLAGLLGSAASAYFGGTGPFAPKAGGAK